MSIFIEITIGLMLLGVVLAIGSIIGAVICYIKSNESSTYSKRKNYRGWVVKLVCVAMLGVVIIATSIFSYNAFSSI